MNLCYTTKSSYEVIEKVFNERKGIVSPVRAIVWNYGNAGSIVEKINTISCALDLYADTIRTRQDAEELLYRFKHESDIVGYFTACLSEDKTRVLIGISMCRPSDYNTDYDTFSMTGKQIAMSRAICGEAEFVMKEDNVRNIYPLFSFKNTHRNFFNLDVRHSDSNIIVYQYLYTIEEQYLHFLKRCRRYFKKESK